jgi:hypothetical protein
MSFSDSRPWSVRWKGEVSTYSSWQDVEDALGRGDLSLLHEIQYNGRWWFIRDFLEKKPWENPNDFIDGLSSGADLRGRTGAGHESDPRADDARTQTDRVGVGGLLRNCLSKISQEWIAVGIGILAILFFFLAERHWFLLILFAVVAVLSSFYLILRPNRNSLWQWSGVGLLALLAACAIRLILE